MADSVASLVLRIESLEAEVAKNRLDNLEQQGKKNESGADRLSSKFSSLSTVIVTLNQGVDLASRAFQMMNNISGNLTQTYYTEERARAKANQVLQATGGAAGVSRKELYDLADQMEKLTGIGDEFLINAQAQILTFTQIGEDIFPTVTERALDLAAVYDGDLKGAVIQVSKALNDFTGYTSLKESGVSFSESQIKLINQFKEQNDLISYQKLILDELNVEFGGTAQAIRQTNFGVDQAYQNVINTLKEIGGKGIAEMLRPGKEAVIEFVNENKDTIAALFTDIPGVAEIAWDTVKAIAVRTFEWETFSSNFNIISENIGLSMQAAFMFVGDSWTAVWSAAVQTADDIGEDWGSSLFNGIMQSIGKAGNWVNKLFGIDEVDLSFLDTSDKFGEIFGKNLFSQFESMGDNYIQYLNDLGGYAVDAGNGIANNYGDIIAKATAEIQALIEKGKAELASLESDASTGKTGPSTTSTSNAHQDEIDKLIAKLEEERDLYGKSENEILRYRLAKLGASEAEMAHVESLKTEIDAMAKAEAQTQILHDSLISLRDTGIRSLTSAFTEFGASLANAEEGMMSFDKFMQHIVNSILQSLPMLFMNAGLQLIAQGQWAIGLGLLFSSLPASIAAGYSQEVMNQNAHGNAFSGGNIVPFAHGGAWTNKIVDKPTLFPMANGGIGLMGEAGDEAIMPLGRTASGDLGVKTIGSGSGDTVLQLKVDIKNYSGEKVEASLDNDVLSIVVGAVRNDYAQGGFDDANEYRYGVKPRGISA